MTDDRNYAYYITAIVDIMGQKEKLKGLECFPSVSRKSEEFKNFKLLFNETVGAVIDFRESIKKLNTVLARKAETPKDLPPKYSELYRKCSLSDVSCYFFSDLAVLSICLERNSAVSASLSSLFINLSLLFLVSLSKGVPLRGAIDVGQGMKMDEGDIYGSCNYHVSSLESDVADYPRIVLGKTFVKYFNELCEMKPDTFEKARNLDILESLKPYIEEDSDGKYILSYLVPSIKEKAGSSNDGLAEELILASKFIQSEIDKHSDGVDDKLHNRYIKVKDYFIRKNCWKV